MATATKQQIAGNFNWDSLQIVPAFAEGEDAKALYEEVAKTLKGNFGYDESAKTMWGSSLPLAARVDTIVRPLGIRVATLSDLSRAEVTSKAKDRFYSDAPAIVMRSTQDSYGPNMELMPGLASHIEQTQGALRLPVLVTGFDIVSADNQYGWDVAPRDDFTVTEDDRLDGKHNGKKFSEVDEDGLPKFDKKGNRVWYARCMGLSRLYLSRSLYLDSDYEYLANSYEYGRVVLVSGEAAGAEFREVYATKLKEQHEQAKSELDRWLNDSLANMPGGKG